MVNDNSDTDIQDENDEDVATPFGGWASAPPPAGGATQAGGDSTPAPAKQPKKETATIPNFSATFGKTGNEHLDLPPVDEILEEIEEPVDQFAVTLERTSDLSPTEFAARAEQEADTLSAASQGNTPEGHPDELAFGAAEDTAPAQEPTVSKPTTNNDDPFAWSPEEAPKDDAPREPRRSFGDDATWMATGDSDFDYEAEKEKQMRIANPQDYEEEEEEEIIPTVNPYTFGKEEEWQAPPMTVEEVAAAAQAEEDAAEAEAAAQAAAAQAREEPKVEAGPASPFDFAAYDDPAPAAEESSQLPAESQEDVQMAGDIGNDSDMPQDLVDPMLLAEDTNQPDITPEAASLPPESTVELEMEPDATIDPVVATEPETAFEAPEMMAHDAPAEETADESANTVIDEPIAEEAPLPPMQAEQDAQQPKTTFQTYTPATSQEPPMTDSPFESAPDTPEESFADMAENDDADSIPENQDSAFDNQETPAEAVAPAPFSFDAAPQEAAPEEPVAEDADEASDESVSEAQSKYSMPPSSPEQFIRQDDDEGGPQAVMTQSVDYGAEPQETTPESQMPPPPAPQEAEQAEDESLEPVAVDPFAQPQDFAPEKTPAQEPEIEAEFPFALAEPPEDYAQAPTQEPAADYPVFDQAPEAEHSNAPEDAAPETNIFGESSEPVPEHYNTPNEDTFAAIPPAPEDSIFGEALPEAEEPAPSDNIFGGEASSEQESPQENIFAPVEPVQEVAAAEESAPDIYAQPEQPAQQSQDFTLAAEPEAPAPMAVPVGEVGSVSNTNNQRHYAPSDIQHILQEHANWLASDGKDGRRANFRNANLQGFDLSSAQLAEASFRGASLGGANLSGSDLRGADLSEAMLENTKLGNANLATAILTRADLRTADLTGADLQGADLSSALMLGANLAGLNLSAAILQETNLQSANLSQAVLQQANLRGANLTGANLSGANLASANCREVRFEHAVLDNAVLQGANMKNASMQGASLIGVDIAAAEETSAEHRQESLNAEQSQIQQEWERIKAYEEQVSSKQAQIQQREMTMQTDRANVERARREIHSQYEGMKTLIDITNRVMNRHRMHDKLFKYFGITWFIFTILAFVSILLFIKALEISDLDWLSLSVVLGGCTLIMGLFIATTIRSIKLSNNLKRLLDVYEQQMPKQDNSGQ